MIDLSKIQDEKSTFQDENAQATRDSNWQLLRQFGSSATTEIDTNSSELKERVSKALGNSDDDEVQTARTNADGTAFDNLKARLDYDDTQVLHVGEVSGTVDEAKTIRISDISTSSSKIKYTVEETLTTNCNPRSQGLVITKLAHIFALEQS